MSNPLRVLITGTTGMVGEGVLQECLANGDVASVLVINRRPLGWTHAKLNELILADFFDLSSVESELSGYDACFFCLGASSVTMEASAYFAITYTLTMYMSQTLSRLNAPMTFCYVSGAGANSSEKGWISWANVKGKTENDLFTLPFRQVFAFRLGFIQPTRGLSNTKRYYKFMAWLVPLGRLLYPQGFCTLQQLAIAMIKVTRDGYPKKIIHGQDVLRLTTRPIGFLQPAS